MKLLLLIALLLLLVACSTITPGEAEVAARDFAHDYVKFTPGNRAVVLDQEDIQLDTQSIEPSSTGDFVVVLNASRETETGEKSVLVTIVVDKSTGEVVEFNGQPVLPNLQ